MNRQVGSLSFRQSIDRMCIDEEKEDVFSPNKIEEDKRRNSFDIETSHSAFGAFASRGVDSPPWQPWPPSKGSVCTLNNNFLKQAGKKFSMNEPIGNSKRNNANSSTMRMYRNAVQSRPTKDFSQWAPHQTRSNSISGFQHETHVIPGVREEEDHQLLPKTSVSLTALSSDSYVNAKPLPFTTLREEHGDHPYRVEENVPSLERIASVERRDHRSNTDIIQSLTNTESEAV